MDGSDTRTARMPMQNTEILSTRCPRARTVNDRFCRGAARCPSKPRPGALVFDARCHLGVVLRAVLFVETVVGVGPCSWPAALPMAGHGGLLGRRCPPRWSWLGTACSPQDRAAAPELSPQYAAGVVLGAPGRGVPAPCSCWPMRRPRRPTGWPAPPAGAVKAVSHAGHGAGAARAGAPGSRHGAPDGAAVAHPAHFLFNTLNSAIALVRANQPESHAGRPERPVPARAGGKGESVTLAEEITLAQRYLAIEEVRFGHRLQVQWT